MKGTLVIAAIIVIKRAKFASNPDICVLCAGKKRIIPIVFTNRKVEAIGHATIIDLVSGLTTTTTTKPKNFCLLSHMGSNHPHHLLLYAVDNQSQFQYESQYQITL